MVSLLRNSGKEILQRLVFRDRFVWRLPADRPGVALTFDDGPDPEFTPAIIDVLAKEGVTATFFVIGRHVQRSPALARRLTEAGHTLGGHGYAHREIVGLPAEDLERELKQCRDAIADATGTDTMLYRPPRGRVSLRSMRAVCAQGYQLVHWSRTYSDYQRDGADALVGRMKKDPPADRDIVLLHDHNRDTVDALARMLPRWRAAGQGFHRLQAV